MKICCVCKIKKKESCFHKDISKKDELKSTCKECSNKATIEWRIRNKKTISLYNKNYHKKNSAEMIKRVNAWRRLDRYGITLSEYESLFRKQDGKCKICKTHQTDLSRALCIDHDHNTLKVRGLLCYSCNLGLGNFKNSEDLMVNAVNYLRKLD